jgi:hypothetical protein
MPRAQEDKQPLSVWQNIGLFFVGLWFVSSPVLGPFGAWREIEKREKLMND